MTGVLLMLAAAVLALLLAGAIVFMPSASPAREAVATVLALPLAGVIAVLIGGYRA
jgi:hypothetical protein